jgi:hypothetical protein
VHLEPEPFDAERNGLLTPTFKLRRPLLARRYVRELAGMYDRVRAAEAGGE